MVAAEKFVLARRALTQDVELFESIPEHFVQPPPGASTPVPPCFMARMNEADHGHNFELFSRFEGLTFDDVVLVPGFSDVLPDMVDTTSWFTPTIPLNVPLLAAAMDKVTEARLAIAMAHCGGSLILP